MSVNWTWSSTFTRCVELVISERWIAVIAANAARGIWIIKADDTKVYAILDEVFLAGEIEETSKQVVLTRLAHLDKLE